VQLARGALRPLVLPWLRRWVAGRPVVLIETPLTTQLT
jgi:hypothetical protein